MLGLEFLKRQLIYALIEKASLIFERQQGRDVRDMSVLDIHLSKLIKALKDENVVKPVETLASALQKSGVIKDITKTGWSVRTLQNRISRVSQKDHVLKKTKNSSPIQLATIFIKDELPQQSKLILELSASLSEMKEPELYVNVPANSKFIFPYLLDR